MEPGGIEPGMNEPDTLRLFFALWPNGGIRTALNHTGKWLHHHWDGRRMLPETLHLTLAFLGRTPVDQLNALTASVDAIEAHAFELTLDQPGHWHQNRIGWLGPSQPPPQLGELVSALNTAIQQSDIAYDARPHVTLLRNTAGGEVHACEPVRWPVSDFVLVSSRTEAEGARYEVIQRWPLT